MLLDRHNRRYPPNYNVLVSWNPCVFPRMSSDIPPSQSPTQILVGRVVIGIANGRKCTQDPCYRYINARQPSLRLLQSI